MSTTSLVMMIIVLCYYSIGAGFFIRKAIMNNRAK